MDTWKKHILNRGEESTSIAALVCFKLIYFSILWKFSLENDKNLSVEMNSKPKNCVEWAIAFLSRTLSNKEVIGSTEVNLGDFLSLKYIIKSKWKWFSLNVSLWFKNFVCLSDTRLAYYESLRKKSHMQTVCTNFSYHSVTARHQRLF